MIDAYEIGAKIVLDARVFEDTERLAGIFGEIQDMLIKINAGIREMVSPLRDATASARSFAAAWSRVADQATRAADAVRGATLPGGAGGSGGGRGFIMLPGEEPHGRLPSARGRDLIPTADGGGFGGGGDDGGIPLGSPGPFGGWNARRGGRREHDHLNDLFMGGLVAHTAWEAARYGWGQAANPAHIRAQMLMQGMADKQANAMMARARHIQQTVPGVSYTDAATALKDAFVITRSVPEALAIGPTLARNAVVLHAANNTNGIEGLFLALASGELKGELNHKLPNGEINTAPMLKYLNLATQISVATGGRFSPADFKRMAGNAGPLFRMMDSHALTEAAVLSMGLGAAKTGTGINAFGLQFIGGRMNEASAMLLEKLGLVNAKDAIHIPIGTWMLRPGAVKDQKLFAADPFEWIEKDMLPAIAKDYPKLWIGSQKINRSDMTEQAKLAGLYQLFSRIPAGKLAAEVMFSLPLLHKYTAAIDQTPGPTKAIGILRKNDPLNALEQLTAATDAMVSAFATPDMKEAVKAMHGLTGVANDMSNWFLAHPDFSRRAGYIGAGAGAFGLYKFSTAGLHYFRKMLGMDGAKGGGAGDASFLDDAEAAALRAGRGGLAGADAGPWGMLATAIAGAVGAGLEDRFSAAIKAAGGEVGDAIGHFLGMHDIPVHVTNGHDLADGVTHHQAKDAGHMPTGSVRPNVSLAPPAPGQTLVGAI